MEEQNIISEEEKVFVTLIWILHSSSLILGGIPTLVSLVFGAIKYKQTKDIIAKQHYKESFKASFLILVVPFIVAIPIVFISLSSTSSTILSIIFIALIVIALISIVIGYYRIIKGLFLSIKQKPYYKTKKKEEKENHLKA